MVIRSTVIGHKITINSKSMDKKHLDGKNFLKYTFRAHCSQDSCSLLTSSPLHARTLASLHPGEMNEESIRIFGCHAKNACMLLRIMLLLTDFVHVYLLPWS